VPPVAARHAVPDDWRFLLVRPDADPGRSGDAEDDAMRTAVERAEPGLADRIGGIVTRRVLPAIATGNAERFGAAVAEIGRLNGAWYADEQGGVPPAGRRRGRIAVGRRGRVRRRAVVGGPTVYGITDAANATAAASAGERALDEAGVDGSVSVVEAANGGARVTGGSEASGDRERATTLSGAAFPYGTCRVFRSASPGSTRSSRAGRRRGTSCCSRASPAPARASSCTPARR